MSPGTVCDGSNFTSDSRNPFVVHVESAAVGRSFRRTCKQTRDWIEKRSESLCDFGLLERQHYNLLHPPPFPLRTNLLTTMIASAANSAANYLAASAVSFTMAGNTGVLPFLSLFVIGIVERFFPNILNMVGWTEMLLSSWLGIAFFGIMTILEIISMCIPVVDEIIDSIMTFVIPFISIIASISTFGIYGTVNNATQPFLTSAATTAATHLGIPNATNVGGAIGSHAAGAISSHFNSTVAATSVGGTNTTVAAVTAVGGAVRRLNTANNMSVGMQITVACVGLVLALSLHFFKMVVRLIGEGWLTPCLTVLEVTWCVTTVFVVIFIRPLAIFVALVAIICACFGMYYFVKRGVYKLSARQRQDIRDKKEGRALLSGEETPEQLEYGTDQEVGGWGALRL